MNESLKSARHSHDAEAHIAQGQDDGASFWRDGLDGALASELIGGKAGLLCGLLALVGLFVVSRYNFLLFHALGELLSIAVAWALFVLVWSTRRAISEKALVLVGVAYFFIGFLDLVHTLAYKGMGVFSPEWGANLPTQLWIAARTMESLTLILFSLVLGRKIGAGRCLFAYATLTALALLTIFRWRIFPVCYQEGIGLTPFKIVSEYLLCLVLALSMALLLKKRRLLDPVVFRFMLLSILSTIVSELTFTFYVGVYGLPNVAGHFFKILSYFFIYRSLIHSGLSRPLETLFGSLRTSQENYRFLYETMAQGVTILDSGGVIVEANPAACRILGTPRDQLIGKSVSDSAWKIVSAEDEDIDWDQSPALKTLRTGIPTLDNLCGVYNSRKGQCRWILFNSTPRFSNGESTPSQVQNVFSDLTERKRAEDALRERIKELHCLFGLGRLIETPGISLEDVFRGCVALVPQGLQHSSLAWTKLSVGSQTYSTENYQDGPWKMSCPIEAGGIEIGRLEAGYPKAPPLKDNQPFCREEEELLSSLSERLGRVVERFRVEEALRASEEEYRALLEGLPDLLVRLDKQARFLFVSDNAGETMGLALEDAIGKTPAEAGFTETHCALLENCVSEVFTTGRTRERELTLTMAEGARIFNIRFVPERNAHGEVLSALCVCRDNTEHRKAEQDYRSLFNEMLDGFALHEIICDENGKPADYRFLAVNPAFERLTGLNADAIVGRTVLEVLPATEMEWIERYGRVALTGEPHSFENYSGDLGRHFTVAAYRSAPGQFACIFADVTERKRAEADRERLIQAIEQSGETIVITDAAGVIQYVNPSFERITGYSREEAVGKNPSILKSGEHGDAFYADLWGAVSSGKTWEGRIVNKRKDGSLFTEKATISPVMGKDGGITGYIGVKRDITEEIKLEERLSQSQKMEAIGSLAGGIAHDFNNILTPIFGFTEMLREDLPQGSSVQGHVEEIFHAAMRARDLVRQILTFSRQDDQVMGPIRLQPVVKEAMKLLRSTIPTTIAFQVDIEKDCGIVIADPTQIHQIVMNLATNAYHAMERTGGTLSLSLKEVSLDPDENAYPELSGGKFARLTVSDTGEGMNEGALGKIFDPYYTTKPRGKGTGLGLAVVHGIVTRAQGAVRVYSEKGKGAEFRILLPIKERVCEKTDNSLLEPIAGGNERILLVDDEPPVTRMEQIVLERLGYKVTARTSSLEALEAFKASPQSFDLVVTDMTMPDMTGIQMAVEMRKIRPGLPVIICTGFSDFIDEEKARAMGIQGYVMKPVVKRELAAMLRKVLG